MAGPADGAWNESTGDLSRAWDAPGPSARAAKADAVPLFTFHNDTLEGSRPGGLSTDSWTIAAPSKAERDPAFHFSLSPADGGVAATLNQSAVNGGGASVPPGRPVEFPEPGSEVAGFRLISELGRGAFARVFLAEQTSLANRLVALKVSKASGDEYRVLARLQHAHIVPIHSVHHDPATGLRLLCMPYLGGANLAQVLEAAEARLPAQATGGSLVEALDVVGTKLSSTYAPARKLSRLSPERRALRSGLAGAANSEARGSSALTTSTSTSRRSLWRKHWARVPLWDRFEERPALRAAAAGGEGAGEAEGEDLAQPARHFLRHASYLQAAVWIAARLAEGLDHAHSRGLVHRDLKPSNVLIAADGTPMLLDFNLATDSAPDAVEGARATLGGTLPYMAPEHLDAFNPRGKTPPEAVDERSDLYSLGLILFEMTAGRPGFEEPPPGTPTIQALGLLTAAKLKGAPSLRAINGKAPWSLDAILRKCLDPEPSRRYARARDLAEDLGRFLADKPLAHAAEPSVRERMGKWARRNPRATSSTSIALLATTLLMAFAGVTWALRGHLETASARLKLAAFRESFERCQLLLNTGGPAGHLEGGVALARRAMGDYGVGGRGDWTAATAVRRLSVPQRLALREDVAELALLLARAEVVLAGPRASDGARRRALTHAIDWLDRAEKFDPHPSAALFLERARFRNALGLADLAVLDRARAAALPPTTPRDFYLDGTAKLARGETDRAELALARSVSLDARRFWAWFALGLCHMEQARNIEASGDFGVCAALAPDFAWPHLNRGLALARAGRLAEARQSYDRAIETNGQFAEALVDRGLVLLELGDAAGAVPDFDKAAALGRRDPALLAARGEALARLGRRDEAARAFDQALAVRPRDPILRVARGFFRLSTDPTRAEADFRAALEVDPPNARAHLGLAFHHKADDPRAAQAEADAALDADPMLGDARQLRALLSARLGDASALGDVDRLVLTPTPARLYNAACAVSILSRTTADPRLVPRAMALLNRALDVGLPPSQAAGDPDLEPLRALREFRERVGPALAAP